MTRNGIKLKLALSSHGSILCTAQNKSDHIVDISHSAIYHHTDLFIFDSEGCAVPFSDRLHSRSADAKDKKGHPVAIAPNDRIHLSHSRILFDDQGRWGITWGRMRYRGLSLGIYRFIASHRETESSNLVSFEIDPSILQ